MIALAAGYFAEAGLLIRGRRYIPYLMILLAAFLYRIQFISGPVLSASNSLGAKARSLVSAAVLFTLPLPFSAWPAYAIKLTCSLKTPFNLGSLSVSHWQFYRRDKRRLLFIPTWDNSASGHPHRPSLITRNMVLNCGEIKLNVNCSSWCLPWSALNRIQNPWRHNSLRRSYMTARPYYPGLRS